MMDMAFQKNTRRYSPTQTLTQNTRLKLNIHWSLLCKKFYELVQFFKSPVLRGKVYAYQEISTTT